LPNVRICILPQIAFFIDDTPPIGKSDAQPIRSSAPMRLAFALAFAIPATHAAAEPKPVTPEAMKAHISFLADDLLEGRDTGSRGHEIAARYVASELEAAGLTPANTGSWFQQVPFVSGLVDQSSSKFSIAGQSFTNRSDVLFGAGRKPGREQIAGNVVFGGYCIHDPKRGQRDFAGLALKGKIVACLQGFPVGMPSDVGAHYGRTKAQMAQAAGAVGIINIRTLLRERTRTWARELEGPIHPSLAWRKPDGSGFSEAPGIQFGVTLHDKAAAALFAGAKVPLTAILAEADKTGGRPKGFALTPMVALDRTTTGGTLSSPNVVAMLPGSDPALAKEVLLVMAHLDHVGVDEKKDGDKIFNGAMDNATGTAALIEAAKALAASAGRPKRSILFAAVTAEEKGLIGADYLARHPIVDGRVVAVVNLDMPVLLYDFKDVIAFGAEHSTMGSAVAAAGAKLGVALSPDPLPAEGLFTRSDHYRFVQQGVPSIFLMTGFQNGGDVQFAEFLKTHYHRVTDDLARPIDWKAAAKFATLNTLIAAEIANAPAAPMWFADSFFGAEFAAGAAKAVRAK
jgi:Peptidase family M28